MWERMFDLVLGLKKEHRLMMVITLIYAVTLFGITVDVEAMENWLQLVGYTIRTLCIACIIQLSVFFLTNIFWKEQVACWDLFTTTGGKNSCRKWHSSRLMGRDRIHFTKEGYQEQGTLLFRAFMESYNNR